MHLEHNDGHRKRLKAKFKQHGVSVLHDYEVLELLLTYCIRQKDVKPVAKRLLAEFGTFQRVLDASRAELQNINGIGEHSALLLKLVRDCSDFYLRQTISRKNIISSPQSLVSYLQSSMQALRNEQFRVLYLNAKNEILSDEIIQEGTVDQTAVYPRKIVEHALAAGAVSLILVHNHPSGDPCPSAHDKNLTGTIIAATKLLSIRVHDHIIVGKHGYYSFAEHGCI